jgi:hypothetical protein
LVKFLVIATKNKLRIGEFTYVAHQGEETPESAVKLKLT